jgi:hypothetical protein
LLISTIAATATAVAASVAVLGVSSSWANRERSELHVGSTKDEVTVSLSSSQNLVKHTKTHKTEFRQNNP